MKRRNKFAIVLILVLCMCCLFVGCDKDQEQLDSKLVKQKISTGYYVFSLPSGSRPAGTYVEMDIETSDGLARTITILMLPQYAPKTVENFLSYVESGFYNNTVIHRIVQSGCLQGGGYEMVNSSYSRKSNSKSAIVGEFASNGHPENLIAHVPGVISTARTNEPNSATSEFFLCTGEYPSWNGEYAGFGFMPDTKDVAFIQRLEKTTTCNTREQPSSRTIYIRQARVVKVNG